MRIATWNINSVRLRIAHVLRFIKEQNIDVMCLQETFKIMKLFISLLTFIFISSCSFFDETECEANMIVKNGLWYLPNEEKPFSGNNICVYKDGSIAHEGKIKNGEDHGYYKSYYRNGRIWKEGEYDMGVFTGKHTIWSIDGQKLLEGEYVKHERHGIWYNWDQDGMICSVTKYNKGVIIDRYENRGGKNLCLFLN